MGREGELQGHWESWAEKKAMKAGWEAEEKKMEK